MKTEYCRQSVIDTLKNLQGVTFLQNTPEQCITVSFLRKMLVSAQAVLNLGNDGYDACIIASHMAEGILLLNWLLDDTRRIKDYEDYNIIEILPLLKVDSSHKKFLLQEIQRRNIARFLKKDIKINNNISEDILLNQENYYNRWYKPDINALNHIPQKLKSKESQEVIQNIHEIYHELCAYKHFSPIVMPSPRSTTDEWVTKPLNSAMMATMHCLHVTLLYTKQFQ